MDIEDLGKAWNGQRITKKVQTHPKAFDDYVLCDTCGKDANLRSTAWYDYDGQYRHYSCLSLARLRDLKLSW